MTAVSAGVSGAPKDYFELFQVDPQFDIDLDDLGRRFRTLQRRFHPDRYISGSATDQRLAAQVSADINAGYQALKDPINAIVEAVKRALERTPPELSADILDQGIVMTGGGSMLQGIDQLIRERTNVPVNIAEDPLLSVVKGTGKVLEDVKKYESVLI